MAENIYQYYVEGENEERIVKALKTELRLIQPGKVTVFDAVKEEITKARLMRLKKNTVIVLVFDTDTDNADTLLKNIDFIKKQNYIKKLLCVTQVKNLEDELIRSCCIRDVKELTGSETLSDYKKALNNEKNLGKKLQKHSFDIHKFWSKEPGGAFSMINNESEKIKLE